MLFLKIIYSNSVQKHVRQIKSDNLNFDSNQLISFGNYRKIIIFSVCLILFLPNNNIFAKKDQDKISLNSTADLSLIFMNIKSDYELFLLRKGKNILDEQFKEIKKNNLKKMNLLKSILLVKFKKTEIFNLYFLFFSKSEKLNFKTNENYHLESFLRSNLPGIKIISVSNSFPFYFDEKLFSARLITWRKSESKSKSYLSGLWINDVFSDQKYNLFLVIEIDANDVKENKINYQLIQYLIKKLHFK